MKFKSTRQFVSYLFESTDSSVIEEGYLDAIKDAIKPAIKPEQVDADAQDKGKKAADKFLANFIANVINKSQAGQNNQLANIKLLRSMGAGGFTELYSLTTQLKDLLNSINNLNLSTEQHVQVLQGLDQYKPNLEKLGVEVKKYVEVPELPHPAYYLMYSKAFINKLANIGPIGATKAGWTGSKLVSILGHKQTLDHLGRAEDEKDAEQRLKDALEIAGKPEYSGAIKEASFDLDHWKKMAGVLKG